MRGVMKLVIIGGVAGGAAAAARARRLSESARIIMLERGEHVSFANCGLPYYMGGVIEERGRLLVQSPHGLKKRFNIDVRIKNRVESIDRDNKKVTVNDLTANRIYTEDYDYLILSPGAEPIRPHFEGSDLPCVHVVRTISDIDRIKEKVDSRKARKAVVIGAGFIGLEMAENLRERGIETYLIEKTDQVMPPFDNEMVVMLEREIVAHDVRLFLNEEVVSIKEDNFGCAAHTASGKKIDADIVIMAIGVIPETKLAKEAGLEIGEKGILVDNKMRTSDKSIFAVGDAVEVKDPILGGRRHIPLAGPAAKQSLVAVNNIFGIDDEYKGSIGTSIVKVFTMTAAMTGANEKSLKTRNHEYDKVYTYPADHVGYYPGAHTMALKLLYDPKNGTILGAQAVGRSGIDRKIDVLAVAVKQGSTIRDLAEFEFCYAPPYGTSKDAVNLAAMVALNHTRGLTKLVHWENITRDDFLLDVRTPAEFKKSNVPNSINVPVDELRGRLEELPKNRKIFVFCQVGIRAHIACRILAQFGYEVFNISGGYLTFINYRDAFHSGKMITSQMDLDPEVFCTGPTGESRYKNRPN